MQNSDISILIVDDELEYRDVMEMILGDNGFMTDTACGAEEALVKAEITVNKNTIPFDQQSPFVTSGVRIGTPAVTQRGMKEAEMKEIASLIERVIDNIEDETELKKVKEDVRKLSEKFPLYR